MSKKLNYISIFILFLISISCKNEIKNTEPHSNIESELKTDIQNNHIELDYINLKYPFLTSYVNKLKNDTLFYEKCSDCNLPGLDNENIMGYTDRVRPTGNYFRKDIKIGDFEFDTFFVYEKKNYKKDNESERVYKRLYLCYFNEKQRKEFDQFSHYYENMINHGKQILDIEYLNNTTIITIQYAGY